MKLQSTDLHLNMVYVQAEWQNLQFVTVVLKMAFELEFKWGWLWLL